VFEGNLFAIEDYNGLMAPSKYLLDKAAFWVRMHNLPLACMSMAIGQQIGVLMGHVEEVGNDIAILHKHAP
jgi:tRNA A-37 threonylcarbamoyl transferase component Bud32